MVAYLFWEQVVAGSNPATLTLGSLSLSMTGLLYAYRSYMHLVHLLAFTSALFLLGVWGIFLNRKNIIVMLMSIELMLLAVNTNFLVFSLYVDDLVGQVFALFILTVAAAESSIGLALLVIYYRARGTVAVEFMNLLKG